jgi:hypothetical protein
MAQTRASSKVLASVLRFVPVLAGFKPTPADELDEAEQVAQEAVAVVHEVEPVGRGRPPAQTVAPAVVDDPTVGAAPSRDVVYITDVQRSATKNPNVIRFTLTIAGGPGWPANQTTVRTIRKQWGELAEECQKAGAPVRLRTKRTEYGLDVASLERVDDQGNALPLTSDDIPPFR